MIHTFFFFEYFFDERHFVWVVQVIWILFLPFVPNQTMRFKDEFYLKYVIHLHAVSTGVFQLILAKSRPAVFPGFSRDPFIGLSVWFLR